MNTGSKPEYEKTQVQCLVVRNGKNGRVYYGRTKRNHGVVMKRLGTSFEKALPLLRAWLTEVTDGTAPAPAGPVTWGELAERYLIATDNSLELAQRSKDYRHECTKRCIKVWTVVFLEDLRERQISTITADNCAAWARTLSGHHVTTYNNTVATMKHILALAVEDGTLPVSPAAKLKRLGKIIRVQGSVVGEHGEELTPMEREALATPDEESPRWYPTPEQLAQVFSQMRSYKFGPCQAAADFAELLSATGCRLSEANKLRWSDVDAERNRLLIHGAKGRATSSASSIRYLPITPPLAALLARLRKAEHQPDDRIARVSDCRGTMQRACVELKLPRKLDHHDLRHAFATRAIGAGIPIPVVSDWLGHKDGGAVLLKTYRHEQPEVSQEWAQKMKEDAPAIPVEGAVATGSQEPN